MNRYQFEDLISEYIDNQLPLQKRKEFELYLNGNPDAIAKIQSVQSILYKIKRLPKKKANLRFNEKLMDRLKLDSSHNKRRLYGGKLFFGFTPINATLMAGLLVAFIIIIVNIVNPSGELEIMQKQFYTNETAYKKQNTENLKLENVNDTLNNIVNSKSDSIKKNKKDYSEKIKFVND